MGCGLNKAIAMPALNHGFLTQARDRSFRFRQGIEASFAENLAQRALKSAPAW
jgi:hypothetical protein